jgi:hypothetical protein
MAVVVQRFDVFRFAPWQPGAATPKIVNFFFREP